MTSIKDLEAEVNKIKLRNKKVEADKAWEVSVFKKLIIGGLTYFVIVTFMVVTDLPKPFINAIVPTVGFVVSTMSLSLFKKFWLKYVR